MANSDIVSSLKNKVIDAMVSDDETGFADAIYNMIAPNKEKAEVPSDLADTYIFRFNRNPEVIEEVCTFITVTVDLNQRDRNGTFINPILTIYVYSHNDHMIINGKDREKLFTYIDKETGKKVRTEHYYDNRNDFISILLDEKFNGTVAGIGELKLISNTEGIAGTKFLCRRLIFETIDLNDSLCGGD